MWDLFDTTELSIWKDIKLSTLSFFFTALAPINGILSNTLQCECLSYWVHNELVSPGANQQVTRLPLGVTPRKKGMMSGMLKYVS